MDEEGFEARMNRQRERARASAGRTREGERLREQALALAQEAQETFLEWQGMSDLGFLWVSRDYSQAGQWFHRALGLAQALADPRLQANSLNRLGNWLVNTGQVSEGIQAHQQALGV